MAGLEIFVPRKILNWQKKIPISGYSIGIYFFPYIFVNFSWYLVIISVFDIFSSPLK